MVTVGQIHFVLAVVALASGASVVAMKKGKAPHRIAGFAYAVSMYGVVGTALVIYNLTGRFGPFHVLAIVALVTLTVGVAYPLLNRASRRSIASHAFWMSWSYVGLVAAAGAETLTRVPDAPFWWAVLLASGLVIAVGAFLIYRNVPRIVMELFPDRRAVDDQESDGIQTMI